MLLMVALVRAPMPAQFAYSLTPGGALIISSLLAFCNASSFEVNGEFSTINRTNLIAHELINPFTPYFRDPHYRGKRVCKGFSTWQDAIFNNYEKLKASLDLNCTHILGNLVISEIGPDQDIDFLNSIEEVSGYVFVYRSLRLTRKTAASCRILNFLHLKYQSSQSSLRRDHSSKSWILTTLKPSILMYGVGFFDNPGLCYAPFSVNWDDILEYPDLQPVILAPRNNKSATFHWLSACAARYNNASQEVFPTAMPPVFDDVRSKDTTLPVPIVRIRREIYNDSMTSESLIFTEPSTKTKSEEISAISTPELEGSSIATDSLMQKDDENPEIFIDENVDANKDADDVENVTEVIRQNETVTNNTGEVKSVKREFEEMLTNETLTVLDNLFSQSGSWLKWKCHDSCPVRNGRSYCWGPSAHQCQILRKCQTRVCGGPNRCVKVGDEEECCHEECVGGCSGPRANECIACRRYLYEGNCVPACPARRVYNIHTSSWELNKEGRFALGHVCVPNCPEGFLQDGDHCVLKCSRLGTQQNRNLCEQCPPSGCPKSCSAKQLQLPSVDFLYRSLLKQMVNCTFWEGNIILKKQSFEGDIFHNLTKEEEAVTLEDLQEGLRKIKKITGILYVSTEDLAPWLKNLTFLSNLRHIGGEAPQGYASPLQIVHNYHLEHLGLTSLSLIGAHRGVVQIFQNPKLCLADTIKWRSIMWMPGKPPADASLSYPFVFHNRPANECEAEGIRCDENVCDLTQGCWGPGPSNCRLCAHWLIQGRGEISRCVLNCSLAEGGYYPVNAALRLELVMGLTLITATMDVLMFCMNKQVIILASKDGEFCRAECPLGKFPDEENVCQECATVCTSYPQGLYGDSGPANWRAVCTGPGDWFGVNGCSQCIQVVSSNISANRSGLKLKCLTPYQHCPKDTFLHLISVPRGEPEEEIHAKIKAENSLVHVPQELFASLGGWLVTHQSQRGRIGMVRICAPCHPQCAGGCSGPSPNQCMRCRNARYNGICLDKCYEGTYETNGTDGERLCLPCHDQCGQSCTGPLASDCDVCRHYKQFTDEEKSSWICVESCPPGITSRIELNSITKAVEFVCLHDKNSNNSGAAPSGRNYISPTMLQRLSWLSKALLVVCGLVALSIAIYFSYICSKIVVSGRNLKSGLVVDKSETGFNAKCYRFWMKSVIVPEADDEKYEAKTSKPRRNISLRSLPVRSSVIKNEEEANCLMKYQSDAMPDMTTLLIIPEYQLKLGSRVGGGAFGSVYRGIWYKGPISPSFAKEVDNMFAKAARDDLEKPKFVPLDSLVEDNTYASTEQEYLTVEEDDDKEKKPVQRLDGIMDTPQKSEQKPLSGDEDIEDPKENLITRPNSLTKEFRYFDNFDEENGEDRHMENIEEHVVAIKVLNDETDSSTSKALLEEARVMATVNHPCCLRLLALCMTARPQLVTSFLPLGCLLSYLHLHGGPYSIDTDVITPEIMLNWAGQIASGMAYLASRGIIHRDLAARNVLVETPEQIKITDFGLAKCIDDTGGEYTSKGGLMPVKWLAIECIKKRIFSSKSDVWAYGVTLWEIFTLGRRPFEKIHTRHLIQHLEKGLRLAQPVTTSLDLYELMADCWLEDPDARPNFDELFQRISYMQLEPLAFLNFKQQGRSRLWSDSGLSASSSGYVATTIHTATVTSNTSTLMKSVSEASVPNTSAPSPNYQERDAFENESEVRYASQPIDDRYGIMKASTSCQQLEHNQHLECIIEDNEESSVLDNDYEQPKESIRRTSAIPSSETMLNALTTEDYLEPKENAGNAEIEEKV
ncbi:hypothetical protein Aperf_G00000061121 [Anoplocephala perfoliata]